MTTDNPKLVVTHIISGDLWAGAEVQVYNLCRALKASDRVAPTVVTFNEGILYSKLKELGIPVSLANEKKLAPLAIARSISAHCKEQGSKVVHTHGFKENVLGVLAKWSARIPFSVRTVHGNPETEYQLTSPIKWCIHKLDVAFGQLGQDAIVAVSDQLEQSLGKLFGSKVHKIHNFIDVEHIRTLAGVSDQESDFTGKKASNELTLALVGRLVPVKRVDLFIDTIKSLNEAGIACRGVIFGSGPLEENLRQQAQAQCLDGVINFRGFVDPVVKYLTEVDALVMPSDHEGLPMTILEALALEIPVIAHNKGGIPEALQQGESGWLVDNHSAKGYSEAVAELLTSEAATSRKTKQGLAYVRREFGVETNRMKYLRLYELLGNSRTSSDGARKKV